MKYNLYSKPNQYLIDGFIVGTSFCAAYLLRFEGAIPRESLSQMWGWLPVVVAGRLGINHLFGTYRRMWRYVSIVDALELMRPFAVFSAILLALRLFLPATLAPLRVPLSIILVEGLISFTGSLSARLLRRILYQRQQHAAAGWQEVKRVLLVGAGVAGAATVNMLGPRPDRKVVGFLDDDPQKAGAVIGGVPVLGPVSQLRQAVEQYGVNEVVICLSRAPRDVLKRIWRLCEGLEVRTLIVPTLEEFMEGEVQVSRLRQVSMEELLGREAVEPLSNPEELTACYRGKRILVTGAGGSIGSELARQLAACEPECLLLLDKDENGLYELSTYFSRLSPPPPIELLVADLRSPERLRSLFEKFRPQMVFHAAAHKHVPLMESNPSEAVLNNVFGTVNLLEQGVAHGSSLFVFISTDKAARPASIMGASKRLGELLVESKCQPGKVRFACVRFGNVMSSRGSVIPLFQKQIAAGGPVTLTDPDVSRYFMTIPEAVQLVTCVGLLSENGGTYVLDMKDPIRIADLARDLIELAGLRPGQDIRIETIGLRPGEKLHEELIGEGETLASTTHPRIFAVRSDRSAPPDRMEALLSRLRHAAEQNDGEEIHRVFETFPIAFRPPQNSAAAAVSSNASTRTKADEPAGRIPTGRTPA